MKTIRERLDWTANNHELITKVATSPLENYISEWEAADEPWQFLAACEEYYHCIIECDRQTTSLPIAVDAAAADCRSSVVLHTAKTAQLVNVLLVIHHRMHTELCGMHVNMNSQKDCSLTVIEP